MDDTKVKQVFETSDFADGVRLMRDEVIVVVAHLLETCKDCNKDWLDAHYCVVRDVLETLGSWCWLDRELQEVC